MLSGPFDDPDRDGVPNRDESLAGTNPKDASSYLRVESLRVDGTTVRLSFKAAAGKNYSVLYRDDLAKGAWQKLTDVPARALIGDAQVTDATSRPSRYYRLVTPPQP